MEEHRKRCWLNHKTEVAVAAGDDAFRALLSKKDMLDDVPAGTWPGISARPVGSSAMRLHHFRKFAEGGHDRLCAGFSDACHHGPIPTLRRQASEKRQC